MIDRRTTTATERGTRVIAHRGARAYAPENTIEAIEMAARTGADAVEIDVQTTRDDLPIVFHDDDLARCTDASRRFPDRAPWFVSDFTAAEIRSLDAGGWYVAELGRAPRDRQPLLRDLTPAEVAEWVSAEDRRHYASGNVRVPLLAECIEACRRLRLELHIELKVIPRFPAGLVERVLETIDAYRMQDSVVISSFDHQQVGRVRELGSVVRTAVLTTDRLYRPADYLASIGASAYSPGCYGDFDTIGFSSITGAIDRATIDGVLDAGFDVYVWTENDPLRIDALIEAGVSGIFTDYPDRVRIRSRLALA